MIWIDKREVTHLDPKDRDVVKVFLMDEPVSSFDAKLRGGIRAQIKTFGPE